LRFFRRLGQAQDIAYCAVRLHLVAQGRIAIDFVYVAAPVAPSHEHTSVL
jgi:hypothetical protein